MITNLPIDPMLELIRNSNLIENIDDPSEDVQSYKAWQYISAKKHISQPTLLELHKIITIHQLPPSESGHYRTVDVTVGGRLCPQPYLAQQLCYNWLADLLEYWKTLDPVEMHVRFEKIHPFIDGNGRTGRMLMWWHQQKLGKLPMLIPFDDRQEYYKWFKEPKQPRFI